jgi:hypothetical protein
MIDWLSRREMTRERLEALYEVIRMRDNKADGETIIPWEEIQWE